jgi:long-chain acyl-CoA synthetase
MSEASAVADANGSPTHRGAPRHLDYPATTLPQMFADSAARRGSATCTDFLGQARSYADTASDVARVAAGLRSLGVGPGDRVAVLLPTCPQNLVATLAAQRLGAAVVQHNPLYPTDELEPLFLDHGATVAIAWDNALAAVLPMRGSTPLRHVIGVDITQAMPLKSRLMLRLPVAKAKATRARLTLGHLPEGVTPWRGLLQHGTLPDTHPQPSPGDTAVIMYTSGTTGRAKGVPLTHANLLANCRQGIAWTGLEFGAERFLAVLPMFHAFGLTVGVLVALNLGAQISMLPSPDPALMTEVIEREQTTFTVGVPPLLHALLEHAEQRQVSLRSPRSVLSGAMSLPAEFVERWERATGGCSSRATGSPRRPPVPWATPSTGADDPGRSACRSPTPRPVW